MKIKTILTVLSVSCLLSACGGGGKNVDSSKSAALDACSPAAGPVGTTVTCVAKGMTEDATLFFGGKPVEFILNAEDEVVSFTVPAMLPDEYQVYTKEGDGAVIPFSQFEVTGVPVDGGDGEVAPPEGTTSGGSGGDVITPSGTGGSTTGDETTGGETTGGTTGATTGGTTGGETTPPAPTGAMITTFKVEKVSGADNAMTFKVTYAYSGAKDAYIFGNVFNRSYQDGALPDGDQCKMQETNRYLATNPNGTNLTNNATAKSSSTSNYTKYKLYLEGALCTNDSCKQGPAPSAQLDRRPRDGGRFSDKLALIDVYGLNPAWDIQQKDLVLTPGGIGIIEKMPDYLILEKNPKCRISLKKEDGTYSTTGEFYTRSHAQYGSACLTVKGEDDKLVSKCVSGDAVNAPAVDLALNGDITMEGNAPKLRVKLTYANVIAVPSVSAPAGCSNATGVSWPTLAGHSGTLDALCDITTTGGPTHVNVSVAGVGENNKISKKYNLDLGGIDFQFQYNNDAHTEFMKTCDQSVAGKDCSGTVEFIWRVKRNYTVKEDGTNATVGSGDTHWIKEVKFFEGGNPKSTKTIGSGDDHGIITMARNHGVTSWKADAIDFNPATKAVSSHSWGYTPTLVVTWVGGSCGASEYDDCCGGWDCDDECGVCVETSGPTMTGGIQWRGSHIKEVNSDCGMTIEQPDGSKYNEQNRSGSGSWGTHDQWCKITAVAYDDSPVGGGDLQWTCCK